MKNQISNNLNPWLLFPQQEIYEQTFPDTTISLGVPDDGLPAVTDELRWVSQINPRYPVQVTKTGVSEWCPGTHVERDGSRQTSIELIVQGKGELIVNGREYNLQTNDVFILHTDEHHIYRALPPERFRRQIVFLYPSYESLKQAGLDTVSHVRLSPEKAEYFRNKLEQIDLINRSKQEGFIRTISSEVYELILMLSDEVYAQTDSPVLPDNLKKAIIFVINNLDLELNCEDMACAAHCSTSQLTKQFNRYLNTSPHHWMEHQKIIQSTFLLQNTRKKVFEIAEDLAYCNQFYFSKVFRQCVGMSPTQFRQRLRKKSGKK